MNEAFFPVLAASKVCLRNLISTRLAALYGPNWWDDPAFLAQIRNGSGYVKKTRDKLNDKLKKRDLVTSGRMTAELSFGFWVNMLLKRHEPFFWQDFHAAFPALPAEVDYAKLFRRCNSVREFRNRVFHHEPILKLDITQEYSQVMELIRWLSPKKAEWIKQYSRAMSVLRQRP